MNATEQLVEQFRRMNGLAGGAVMLGTSAVIIGSVPIIGIFFALPLAVIGIVLAIKAWSLGVMWHFPVGMSITGLVLSLAGLAILVLMMVMTTAWTRRGLVPGGDRVWWHHAQVTIQSPHVV